ncbi:MAG: hypothetical protein IPM53_17945 [Anaerolineaceae bacterium]|nr:hypothetical protein [Anaerolineaceae bacterium]
MNKKNLLLLVAFSLLFIPLIMQYSTNGSTIQIINASEASLDWYEGLWEGVVIYPDGSEITASLGVLAGEPSDLVGIQIFTKKKCGNRLTIKSQTETKVVFEISNSISASAACIDYGSVELTKIDETTVEYSWSGITGTLNLLSDPTQADPTFFKGFWHSDHIDQTGNYDPFPTPDFGVDIVILGGSVGELLSIAMQWNSSNGKAMCGYIGSPENISAEIIGIDNHFRFADACYLNAPNIRLTKTSSVSADYYQHNGPQKANGQVIKIAGPDDPCNDMGDEDEDALPNGWEVCGFDHNNDGTIDIDLPAMGADPLVKDIFVEIDYMAETGKCYPIVGCTPGHSHQPWPQAINRVVDAFLEAPIDCEAEENNCLGIRLHVDNGRNSIMNPVTDEFWGNYSRSNSLKEEENLGWIDWTDSSYDWDEFVEIKALNFDVEREGIFHYAVFAHNLGGQIIGGLGPSANGVADIGGSNLIVALGSPWNASVPEQSITFMHELSHNFGLLHGGYDSIQNKPNYLSIMNKSFIHGVIKLDEVMGIFVDGNLSLSHYQLPPLVENNLDETNGLGDDRINGIFGTRYYCGNRWIQDNFVNEIDWNCDGDDDDNPVTININNSGGNQQTLNSRADWATFDFSSGGTIGATAFSNAFVNTNSDSSIGFTYEDAQEIPALYKVIVSGDEGSSTNIALVPGESVAFTLSVTNAGIYSDSYSVTTSTILDWADINGIPELIDLAPGESFSTEIMVDVPEGVNNRDRDEIIVFLESLSSSTTEDGARFTISVISDTYLPITIKE